MLIQDLFKETLIKHITFNQHLALFVHFHLKKKKKLYMSIVIFIFNVRHHKCTDGTKIHTFHKSKQPSNINSMGMYHNT